MRKNKIYTVNIYFFKHLETGDVIRVQLELKMSQVFVCSVSISTGGSYRLTNVLPSAPDMSGLKLGMRSVAGKLSVMASGVVNTIQVSEKL